MRSGLGRLLPVWGLRGRVEKIYDLHTAGLRDPEMRRRALQIVRSVPARDDLGELRAVFEWYRRTVPYRADIRGIDTYATPRRTIEWGGGDCDDATIVLTTLVRHLGFLTGAKVAATGSSTEWNHIYAIAGVPKDNPRGYVALDPTVDGSVVGWEAPINKSKVFLWE